MTEQRNYNVLRVLKQRLADQRAMDGAIERPSAEITDPKWRGVPTETPLVDELLATNGEKFKMPKKAKRGGVLAPAYLSIQDPAESEKAYREMVAKNRSDYEKRTGLKWEVQPYEYDYVGKGRKRGGAYTEEEVQDAIASYNAHKNDRSWMSGTRYGAYGSPKWVEALRSGAFEKKAGSGRKRNVVRDARLTPLHHKYRKAIEKLEGGDFLTDLLSGNGKKADDYKKAMISLQGEGWWSDFKDGFMSVIKPVASVAKTVLGVIPHPYAQTASGVLGALGAGRAVGAGRTITDKMRRRSALVKEIMKSKGLKLGQASKYIKEHNLEY